jgi:cytohesin
VLEVLLKAGADVNAETAVGVTPLHAAAANNPSPAVLEVLLKTGADRKARDERSLVVYVSRLKAGADVNAKDNNGWTPLHWAAAKNPTPAVLEVLLKAGAEPRAINTDGKTPHAVAKPEYRDILWKAMMDKPLK